MNLFDEIALMPEVFDSGHHESAKMQRLAIGRVQQGLGDSRFVRSLRDGEWRQSAEQLATNSKAGQEFLKFLIKRKLLINAPSCNTSDWLNEALSSHRHRPLTGVILDDLTDPVKTELPCATVECLSEAAWWSDKPPSIEIERTPDELVRLLRLLLAVAREMHFIDQYIDPRKRRFQETLEKMLRETLVNCYKPEVFIHTSLAVFSSKGDVLPAFNLVSKLLRDHGRRGRVCVWDPDEVEGGFHDRHFVTDLAGCQIGAGFDISCGAKMIVSVHSRAVRLSVLKRFDCNPNSEKGLLWYTPIGVNDVV